MSRVGFSRQSSLGWFFPKIPTRLWWVLRWYHSNQSPSHHCRRLITRQTRNQIKPNSQKQYRSRNSSSGIIISHKGVRLVTHQPQPQYINKRVKILSRSTQSNIVNSARNTQCGIRFIRQSTYMMVGWGVRPQSPSMTSRRGTIRVNLTIPSLISTSNQGRRSQLEWPWSVKVWQMWFRRWITNSTRLRCYRTRSCPPCRNRVLTVGLVKY